MSLQCILKHVILTLLVGFEMVSGKQLPHLLHIILLMSYFAEQILGSRPVKNIITISTTSIYSSQMIQQGYL